MVFGFLKGEFVDVIDWTDDTRDTMVWRFERRGNAIIPTAPVVEVVTIAPVNAQAGRVRVLSDYFYGSGTFDVPKSARIEIHHNSPAQLVIEAMSIPMFNGGNDDAARRFITWTCEQAQVMRRGMMFASYQLAIPIPDLPSRPLSRCSKAWHVMRQLPNRLDGGMPP